MQSNANCAPFIYNYKMFIDSQEKSTLDAYNVYRVWGENHLSERFKLTLYLFSRPFRSPKKNIEKKVDVDEQPPKYHQSFIHF